LNQQANGRVIFGRLQRWIIVRPRALDAAVVVAALIPAAITNVGLMHGSALKQLGAAALVLLQSLPLWWRRSHPLPALLAVTVAVLVQDLLLSQPAAGASILLGVYAASAFAPPRAREVVVLAAGLLLLAGVAGTQLGAGPGVSSSAIGLGAGGLVAWIVGDFVRNRHLAALEMQSERARAELQAAERERHRIARELHDVVAHNVSVIALTAGAARVSGRDKTEALEKVESGARATIAELNRLLGVLRRDTEDSVEPAPSLSRLDELVNALEGAGIEVRVSVTGPLDALPAGADVTGYRLVQEAVTNIIKHAQASLVEISIRCSAAEMEVLVRDDGKGLAKRSLDGGGRGLLGMRERVAMFDGRLDTTELPEGGFAVRAVLKF
jgi:signal transduction histidine kinase